MKAAPKVDRFALFGEREHAIAPEFVHIEEISERSRKYGWTITPHSHPGIFQILLLDAGSGILATDGDEVELVAGALTVLPTGCVHAFRFAPDAEGWVLSIAVEVLGDPRISALCATVRRPGGVPQTAHLLTHSPAYLRLTWLMADIASALAWDRSGAVAHTVAARIALLITLVNEAFAELPRPQSNRHELLADRFRAMVESDFRKRRSIADYARILGTTTPTLTRSCRAAFGKAPRELELDRILLEAMRSLTYSSAGVSQIAGDLGFLDTAYFSRFFKKRSGMTASDFRHEHGWLGAFR